MSRLRNLVLAGAVSALAIGALGAPASAAPDKGTFAVINGIPGEKVDICINGYEIKSNVRYGGKVWKTRKVGAKRLKVFRANPRRCRGTRLAKGNFVLAAGADLTLVATKRAPKVVQFDNDGLGRIPPTGPDMPGAIHVVRHAADLGDVNLWLSEAPPEDWISPSLLALWSKQDERVFGTKSGWGWQIRATPLEKTRTIAKSKFVTAKESRRYEWYLLGTSRKNARFVVWYRPVSM